MNEEKMDRLFASECYIIDFLPKQVMEDCGQYCGIEHYYTHKDTEHRYHNKALHLILKAMCYYHVQLCWQGEWYEQPEPAFVVKAFNRMMQSNHRLMIYFSDEDTLLDWERQWIYLSVYNPNAGMREMLRALALSEGLFFWKASNR